MSSLGVMGVLALATPGCASKAGESTVRVLAASSLTDAFAAVAVEYEASHPGDRVELSFTGSQTARLQIEHGAAADVFASANEDHVQALVSRRQLERPLPFAGNTLVLITPRKNPAALRSIRDLPRASRIVLGAEQAPIGAYTDQSLALASHEYGDNFAHRVRGHTVSRETNARLLRAKVELGEADAGIVYQSDATSTARVHAIAIPAPLNVRARYFVGTRLGAAPSATAFVELLRGPVGQRILRAHGFVAASP